MPPADQRARRVPNEYRRAAVKCDSEWNGTPADTTGAFEEYLASLPPVLGLGFGAFGEGSTEVDTLIGQMAEIASEVPERLGCCHGSEEARGRYALGAEKPPSSEPPGALAVPTCRAGSHPPHPDGDVRGGPGTV